MKPLVLLIFILLAQYAGAAKTLDFYFVDVEGGQATLIVTPGGQSMLVDAGWPGFDGRDAKRIMEAAKAAGVKRIDYLLVTHHHTDHVGGVPELAQRFAVTTFVDHGPTTEAGKNADALRSAYEKAVANGKRLVVKPGDAVPLKGVDVRIVTARGERIDKPLPWAGAANPLCGSEPQKAEDKSENARSAGFVLSYGKFRAIDLADLTWNKEMDLVCPNNRAGEVDLYVVSHHGMNSSNPATIVHALKPRVAVMNNGAKKGGSPDAWQIVRKSPGLEDLWQLHFALAGGKENNSEDTLIANPEAACEGKWLKLSAEKDGSFTIVNARNGFKKSYKVRR